MISRSKGDWIDRHNHGIDEFNSEREKAMIVSEERYLWDVHCNIFEVVRFDHRGKETRTYEPAGLPITTKDLETGMTMFTCPRHGNSPADLDKLNRMAKEGKLF